MNDIITNVKAIERSGLLIEGAGETVKHKIKKQEGEYFEAMTAPMAASLIVLIRF